MSYFTEDLLTSIKLRSFAPISQATFDDTNLLSMAYEELELKLVSDLIGVREDFFLTSEQQSIVANKSHYTIPARSIGGALKDVKFLDANGNVKSRFPRIDVARRGDYALTGEPEAYYFEGDEIVLVPTPVSSIGSVEMHFPAKPSKLVLTSECAKITGKSEAAGLATFTINNNLSLTLSVGDYVDFLSSKAPFKLWSYKAQITAITDITIDVATADVLGQDGATIEPEINDYICPTDCANIPQIPTAFHPVLAQMVCVRLMESLGDINKLNAASATAEKLRVDAIKLVKNRVESTPQKVSTRRGLVRYFR